MEALREEARRKALVKTRERERKELARYPLHCTPTDKGQNNSVVSRRMEDAQRLYNTAQKSLNTFLERSVVFSVG